MSLYTEWRNLSDNHESQEAEVEVFGKHTYKQKLQYTMNY